MSSAHTQVRSRQRAVFHQLTVAEVVPLCADAVAITFDVPEDLADDYQFQPGQSLTVRRIINGRDERRSYSICAPIAAPLRIGVREVPDGLFSHWLVHQVRAGDRIDVATPTGAFTPDLSTPAHHVFIAAGSGITPVLSIATSVLRDPLSTVTLLYGNRRADTVMFADELADLKDSAPDRLELLHILSRESREVELFNGRLDSAKLQALSPLLPVPREVDHWWLCGPFDMVTQAREWLRQLDVPMKRIHQELFFVGEKPPEPIYRAEEAVEGATSELTVVLDGRASTLTSPRNSSILDGATRSRPDLPFACRGGVCGTCRAKITKGQARMRRNFALDESEVAAGFVLTCQSYPISDELTADYDC